jgi:hypothetical protein
MVRIGGKKLPPHWVYVPSRRQVRDPLCSIGADVRRVEFGGTGSGHGSVGVLLGYVERRVAGGAWTFYLRLWGVPETDLSGRAAELAQAALAAIGASVAECAASPAAETIKPTQVLLRFEIGEAGVTSRVSVEPLGQFSFSSGTWWADPADT